MPATCFFNLNKQKTSGLFCPGFGTVVAFSGDGKLVNDPGAEAVVDGGPLPRGDYFVVDRPQGGQHSKLSEELLDIRAGTHRAQWFGLYRNDGVIDDFTYINGVKRGNFRLHPTGYWGRSEGCITLPNQDSFQKLRQWLLSQTPGTIGGVRYYAIIKVQ